MHRLSRQYLPNDSAYALPIRSPSARKYICQDRITLWDPPNHHGRITCAALTTMVSNIKKIIQFPLGVSYCHRYGGYIIFHWGITPERHQISDIGYPLKQGVKKKKGYISTTYKIVKITASHFCIFRHYIQVRGTTYVLT